MRQQRYVLCEWGLLGILAAALVTILGEGGVSWAVSNLAFTLFIAAGIYVRGLDRGSWLLGTVIGTITYASIATFALLLAFNDFSEGAQRALIEPSRGAGFPWPGSDAGIEITLPIWSISVWLLALLGLAIAKFLAAIHPRGWLGRE